MKKIILFVLLFMILQTCFSFISNEQFEDRFFPQMTIEFVSDFQVNENYLYVIENGEYYVPFTFTSKSYQLNKPLELVIFVDESLSFGNHFRETAAELMLLYDVINENGYDVKLKIITSSENKNNAFFSGDNNLLAVKKEDFEAMLNILFNQQRLRVMNFQTILDGVSAYTYDSERQLAFVIVTSGSEIGSAEDSAYHSTLKEFSKSDPDIFVFTENGSFYSYHYYEKLVKDVGGIIYNPENNSIADVLDYYYGDQLYKNVVSYDSEVNLTPHDYFIRLFFNDTREQHEISMNSSFYKTVRINSVTATPFLIKPGESITLKCMTSPVENVVFEWSSDNGEFNRVSETHNEIQWKAPLEEGAYTLKVRCAFMDSVAESETVVIVKR